MGWAVFMPVRDPVIVKCQTFGVKIPPRKQDLFVQNDFPKPSKSKEISQSPLLFSNCWWCGSYSGISEDIYMGEIM